MRDRIGVGVTFFWVFLGAKVQHFLEIRLDIFGKSLDIFGICLEIRG